MTDRIITAEAIISAKDNTGDAFERIGAKLAKVGAGAKSSKAVAELSASLETAQKRLMALDRLQSNMKGFAKARTAFNESKTALEQHARAMRAATAPTREMERRYEQLQGVVKRTASAFEHWKTAALDSKRAAEGLGSPIGKIVAEQNRLRTAVDHTTNALERQARAEQHAGRSAVRHAVRAGAHGDGSLGGLVGLAVAHGAGHMAHRVVETYAEFDKERRYGQIVMGLSNAQQQPLIEQAIRGAGTSRFNDIQWLESQRELAARGYNVEQVLGFTPVAAQIGQAFDVAMPEGVKALEGAMLGFKKDTSTRSAAEASAQRTADLQVKASKISGMSYEDIVAAYKYAAAPAQMAHLSEEQMLAFAAISKKANMGGDEAGVAFRALAKNLLSPTQGAQLALQSAGINYNAFQRMPDSLNTAGFVEQVAKQYGVRLDAKSQAGLASVFGNKSLLNDAAAFMPAVTAILNETLGGDDAKSKHKIAGLAAHYRDASATGVDTDGLMAAMMKAMATNPALANSIFGSKQGGRIFAALGDPAFYAHILDQLQNHSQGFAQKVSDARMEGFSANIQKLNNSLLNVDTAIGRAFDGGGSGGLLSDATSAAAGFAQALAEANPQIIRAAGELAAAGAAVAGWKGLSFAADIASGLKGLGKGAITLEGAAMEAGAFSIAEGSLAVAGGLTVGTLAIAGAAGFALIDWLSHGAKKKLAANDPNFSNPLRAMQMPAGGIDTMPPSGGGGRGRGPASIRKTDLPGHWITARGGVREWVVDAAPAAVNFGPWGAPYFARGGAAAAQFVTPVGSTPMSQMRLPALAGSGLPSLGGSSPEPGPITAKLEGQATVGINIKVDGPGEVVGRYSASSGDIKVSTGSSMPTARSASNGRVAGPN